ncbi:hypothetical protein TrRE_jg10907, partial [Triparma retinervis]
MDDLYKIDPEGLKKLRKDKPWCNNVKYFKSVSFTPGATIKIMAHCQSGVTKGLSSPSGSPIEVMGLMTGRPSLSLGPDNPTIVITNAYPLPIEGFETRVIADDAEVINYMIRLGEMLEETSEEKFCGWYHSHPFDVGLHDHCYFSSTDLSTQLHWQRSEDGHGNPWLGVVVDPLRSLALGTLTVAGFRAFPPEYKNPSPQTCPDGRDVAAKEDRLAMWGVCYDRYYKLETAHHMSSLGGTVMGGLNREFKW